jgi:AraC-like DNA-binding protein
VFKLLTGRTPKQYVEQLRWAQVRRLRGKGVSAGEIARELGFWSTSHLLERARKEPDGYALFPVTRRR